MALRETYWRSSNGKLNQSQCDVTQIIPSGHGGPTFWVDSDGQVDVQMSDSYGQPWFWYRARGGAGGDAFFAGSGLLLPPRLPQSQYVDFAPWHARVLEPDYLSGRRGLSGWDGKSYDWGLLLSGEKGWDWSDPWTYVVIGGTVVAIAGGVALIIASGGLATPLVALGAQSLGVGLVLGGATTGVTMAATGNPGLAGRMGLAVGAGAAAAWFTGGLAFGMASESLTAAALGIGGSGLLPAATLTGGQSAAITSVAGMLGGGVGAGAGAFTQGLIMGQPWRAALATADHDATIGGAIAFAMPWAGAGIRVARGGIARGAGWLARESMVGSARWVSRQQWLFRTDPDSAIIYSGAGRGRAMIHSIFYPGRKMIEGTPGGWILDTMQLYRRLGVPVAEAIWREASRSFARGIEGRVYMFAWGRFLRNAQDARRIMFDVELKTIVEQGKSVVVPMQ